MLVIRPERRECRDRSEQARLRFHANDRAIVRPAQEGRLDERAENALARRGVEAKQPAGLSRRQPQARHLIEFGSDPLEQCGEVHATRAARDAPVAAARLIPVSRVFCGLGRCCEIECPTNRVEFRATPTGMSIRATFDDIIAVDRHPIQKLSYQKNTNDQAFSSDAARD